jgi:fructose-1-phosphate kinase PfkB-like protein
VSLAEAVDAGIASAGASTARTADALVGAGARTAVVTDGPRPAAASDGRHAFDVVVPPVDAINAVGSGDAVSAGLSLGLARGDGFAEALALGIAAGSANAATISAGDLDPALVHAFRERVEVRERAWVA